MASGTSPALAQPPSLTSGLGSGWDLQGGGWWGKRTPPRISESVLREGGQPGHRTGEKHISVRFTLVPNPLPQFSPCSSG